MKRGQLIKVFQRPVTDESYEGIAKIISIYPGDYDKELRLHLCKVQFEIDASPVIRRVKAKHIQK
jgi:hypothetical protein